MQSRLITGGDKLVHIVFWCIEETALTHLRDSMPHTFFVNGQLISDEVISKTILTLFEKRDHKHFI